MASQPKFSTRISSVAPGEIAVRGVGIGELIETATFTEVVALVLTGRRPSAPERRMMDAIFAAAADHGFVATCTSITRYAASGSGSLPASVAAGILGIGSGTAVSHLVAALLLAVAPDGEMAPVTVDQIDAVLDDYRDRGVRIPGLGHPVHRDGDPRTDALRAVAKANGCYDGYPALMDRVVERYAERTGRSLPQNVDGILAAVLLHFGWTPDQIFGLTILALTPSLVAHASEELAQHHVMRIIPTEQVEYLEHHHPEGQA
jgi:citrate synthase